MSREFDRALRADRSRARALAAVGALFPECRTPIRRIVSLRGNRWGAVPRERGDGPDLAYVLDGIEIRPGVPYRFTQGVYPNFLVRENDTTLALSIPEWDEPTCVFALTTSLRDDGRFEQFLDGLEVLDEYLMSGW